MDKDYYRSWTTTGGGALAHCLKYVVGGAAYARMVVAGLNPITPTDAQLAGFADLYLEYDAERHVTNETTDGGLYSFTFAFATNANPGYFDDYDKWKTKTVETRPDGATNTVYSNYVADVILKQLSSGGDASPPLLTSYGYTFFSGATAVQQRTTTWPVVPAGQNGSGVAESRVEQFDAWGNAASIADERGVVTNFTVDVVTGGVSQRIDDATGTALVSDFTLDNLGRTTETLDPSHTVDVGGVATVVRTAAWTVWDDVNHQVRTAQGCAVGTAPNYTFTLVNPVSITILDGDGNMTDQVSATRASTAGPLLPTDTFAQSSYVRWTHNVFSDNDQLTATQVYFAIPASGGGAEGTNYNEQDFGFDSLGRQNKTIATRRPPATSSAAPRSITTIAAAPIRTSATPLIPPPAPWAMRSSTTPGTTHPATS
ncbi:MAG TPA: hypothetical protein VMV69_19650 [Pirellulales bacterium]|nr:hypothetical protein [Pirellulales bacterium]